MARKLSINQPGAFAVQGPRAHLAGDSSELSEWIVDADVEQNASSPLPEAQVQLAKKAEIPEQLSRVANMKKRMLWGTIVAVLVVVTVVVAVLVTRPDDGTGESVATFAPTDSPASDPWEECYGNTGDLRTLNAQLSRRTSFDEFVDISLCEGSKVWVDYADGSIPWHMNLQSNMRIRCGSTGTLSGKCVVMGHTYTKTPLVVNESGKEPTQNVTVEGIVFDDASIILHLYNGGDITFRNCVFKVCHVTLLLIPCTWRRVFVVSTDTTLTGI